MGIRIGHPHKTVPPLMLTTSPVMCRDQSDNRKQIDRATSSVVAIRFNGIDFRTDCLYVSSSNTGRTIAVSIQPGATALTRIFGHSSEASALVNEICPPFEAA